MSLRIARETPFQNDIVSLIAMADAYSATLYPSEGRHPVDLVFLARPEVTLLVARCGSRVAGCGALVLDGAGGSEIKRMIVDPAARGRGVGRALMAVLEREAFASGATAIRLETGPKNRAALALYRSCGFQDRGPFGGYTENPWSVFLEKALAKR